MQSTGTFSELGSDECGSMTTPHPGLWWVSAQTTRLGERARWWMHSYFHNLPVTAADAATVSQ